MGNRLKVLTALFLVPALAAPALAAGVVIDDFEENSQKIGGRSNTYVMAPSRALAIKTDQAPHGGSKALMIKYDKKAKGGPHDSGGWCGYYTMVKSGPRFFDATAYQAITFWVKGEKGDENFMVGVADRHWDEVGDSVKSEEILKYIESGKITTEWQKAVVPLSVFMLELKELASVAIAFEGAAFPNGEGKGTVYIDDMMFE